MKYTLFETLQEVLRADERLVADGELLRNRIVELTHKQDPHLLKLLLNNAETQKAFFTNVDDVQVFDSEHFIQFVSNKQFLPDSYTVFKNKIGLSDGDEFISEKRDVVLNWPYKDCILEGGQTKEDAKRDEVFWNETLAPDQIHRLLDPKVFTNWKRIDAKGEHKLEGFKTDANGDIKDNLIIKGNNLLALHSLKARFAGKVKLIYIDPPYNTGGDSFGYNDKFNHSAWLTFIKNRLEIARDLLADDGSIFIQCDENENAYLRVIADQVFGRDKFINEIIWRYRTYQGQVRGYFPKKHDTIFWYIKDRRPVFSLSYQTNKEETVDYKRWGEFLNSEGQIVYPNYPKTDSRFTAYLNKWTKENGNPKDGDVIYDVKGYVVDDVWEDIKALDAKNKSERTIFNGGQKPEALIHRIMQSVTNPQDLVLDFYLGSGTTAVVAHKMGLQYIGVEQLDYIQTITIPRLKKVMGGELGGISDVVTWKGGGDFVYSELMPLNQVYKEQVEQAKDTKSLARIWAEIQEKGFLSYKLDIKKFDAVAKNFVSLSLADQKRFILESLDYNQLYINYSEIEDKTYEVGREDKTLNKEFYV